MARVGCRPVSATCNKVTLARNRPGLCLQHGSYSAFKADRDTLAAADAHGGKAATGIATEHLVN